MSSFSLPLGWNKGVLVGKNISLEKFRFINDPIRQSWPFLLGHLIA
jgi:hypothetical protein